MDRHTCAQVHHRRDSSKTTVGSRLGVTRSPPEVLTPDSLHPVQAISYAASLNRLPVLKNSVMVRYGRSRTLEDRLGNSQPQPRNCAVQVRMSSPNLKLGNLLVAEAVQDIIYLDTIYFLCIALVAYISANSIRQ